MPEVAYGSTVSVGSELAPDSAVIAAVAAGCATGAGTSRYRSTGRGPPRHPPSRSPPTMIAPRLVIGRGTRRLGDWPLSAQHGRGVTIQARGEATQVVARLREVPHQLVNSAALGCPALELGHELAGVLQHASGLGRSGPEFRCRRVQDCEQSVGPGNDRVETACGPFQPRTPTARAPDNRGTHQIEPRGGTSQAGEEVPLEQGPRGVEDRIGPLQQYRNLGES